MIMQLTINRAAIDYAIELVEQGERARSTKWADSQPSANKIQQYRAQHGEEALANWYLAVDENGAYQFPVGDFRRVHESGVRAARRYGELNDQPALVAAADEILDILDRMNAC